MGPIVVPVYATFPIKAGIHVTGSLNAATFNIASTTVAHAAAGFNERSAWLREEGSNVWITGAPSISGTAKMTASIGLQAGVGVAKGANVHVEADFGPVFSWRSGKGCSVDVNLGALSAGVSIASKDFNTPPFAPLSWHLWDGCDPATAGGPGGGSGGGTGTPGGSGPGGPGGTGGGGGSGGNGQGSGSVTASNNNGQMAVQVVGFPTGVTPYFCHAGGGADFPTGGTVTQRGQVNITSPNQSWSSGLCSGGHSTNMWIGFQGTDGQDYYSNQTVIDVAPRPGAGVSVSNNNGQMAVQVVGFPTGVTPYFCHAGGGADFPTGGTVTQRGQVNITSPNQSWSSGLCSGGHSTNMWIGFQGTDGHDYYSNQTVIDVAASPGASAAVFGSNGQMSLQLSGFPTGTNYYFCHQGDPSQYPTGGAIIGHGQLNTGGPDGTYGPLCSGSGNAWIGVQGADGHDYYTNQIVL